MLTSGFCLVSTASLFLPTSCSLSEMFVVGWLVSLVLFTVPASGLHKSWEILFSHWSEASWPTPDTAFCFGLNVGWLN